MCDEDPKPGSSKEIHSQDDSTKDIQNMTLAEYLALPENKNANLVQPLPWCPHLENITAETIPGDMDVLKACCEECDHVGENWICLVCLTIHCSRYVNEHMLIHGTVNEQPMTLSFSDISVWCYVCNDYIDNPKLYNLKNVIHKSKFGEKMPLAQGDIDVLELQIG